MWSAFITGAAEEATKIIKEENKAISERVIAEMERTLKKRQEAEEASLTKRDEARKQAEALKTLSGGRLTETQIVGILSGGEAETVIKQLRQRTVGPEKLAKLFTPASPDDQAELESYLQDVGKLTGTVPPRVGEDTGAFGLPTRAGRVTRERALAKTGLTEEELYQTRMTTPTGVEGSLDLSALAPEEDFSERKNKARIALLEADPKSAEFKDATNTLSRIAAIEDIGKAKEDRLKESDVRANLRNMDNTIKESMAGPGNLVRIANPDGSFSYGYKKGLKPEVIKAIENARQNTFTSYLREFYSENGEIPDVVRRAAAPFLVSPGTPVRADSDKGRGVPTPPVPAGALSAPKTQEEYDAMPSGTRYIDTDGKIKIKS